MYDWTEDTLLGAVDRLLASEDFAATMLTSAEAIRASVHVVSGTGGR